MDRWLPVSDASTESVSVELSVLMPVYNEIHTVEQTLRRVLNVPLRLEVVIVDDASNDGTTALLRDCIEGSDPRVRVIYQERNGGKGSAIRAGLPVVSGAYVVIQDGDLEYDPQDFVRLVEAARSRGASVVYGSRFALGAPKMRLPNLLVNRLLAAMVRLLYGCPISDEATCYKLFDRQVIQSLPLVCQRFEFCPEVTAKALRRGYSITEVPIGYAARGMSEGKKIRWTDGVEAIWTLLRYRFWR